MKRILFFIALLISISVNATVYHVGMGGDFTTLAQVNAHAFVAGDQILFQRGSTFYGSLTVKNSGTYGNPIAFGAYGTGDNPVITGFTTITEWANEGGGIYSKVITSESATNMVTVDGVQYAMGRYPSTGFLSYEDCNANISITDNQLGDAINWTGAEAVIKKNGYNIDRCLITNHTGNVLTYTNLGGTGNGTAGYGYFIQNDLRTLDQFGEWYHDTATGKFYMYFGVVNPATKIIKAATLNRVVANTAGYDYIIVDGITATGSIFSTIDFLSSTDNCSIINCSVYFSGLDGIRITGSSGLIDSNVVNNCNVGGIAIGASGATNNTVTNNLISNCNLLDGQKNKNTVGFSFPCGILAAYGGTNIQYNRIENVGYNGMHVGGNNSTIKNNYIYNSVSRLDDGGAIYTNSNHTNFVIDGNIIINTVGYIGGTPLTSVNAEGIYLDELCNGVTVQNNSIVSCSGAGIKLHKAHNNIILNNTCFDNGMGLYLLNFTTNSELYGNTISGNKFIAKTALQIPLKYRSSTDEIATFGTTDNNIYARPIDDTAPIYAYQPSLSSAQNYSVSQWKTFSSLDASSLGSPRTISNVDELQFEYNDTKSAKSVTLSQPMVDMAGVKCSVTVTLQPFTSLVLIPAAAYYVSSVGNDSNDGLTPETAWETIDKVNSTTFSAGDNVLFKRGDSFYGTITVNSAGSESNPITYGAYGSGNKPIITGFTSITGWTNEENGIYSKVITSSSNTNMVTVDGVNMLMGRYPNTGYLSFETASTNVSITDNQLIGTPNWTGAEVVIRKNDWTLDRCTITNHSTTTIIYTSQGSTQNATAGYGYFIQNDLRTLDQLGEWYHDTTTGKFYMYFGAVNPTTKTVKVASIDNLFYNSSWMAEYIIVDGLNFQGSIKSAFNFPQWYTAHNTIQNCDILFAGVDGISCESPYLSVLNNTISDCANKGIYTNQTNEIITGNTISKIGLVVGQSMTGITSGISCGNGNTILIQNNNVQNTGYNGISIGSYSSNSSTIKNNYINNFGLNLNDGGGIYTTGSHTSLLIDGNIILNATGNYQGTIGTSLTFEGIYLDEFASGITVSNNTIANCSHDGIKLHKSSNCTLTGNTIYNNANGIDYLNSANTSVITGHILSNNTIIAKTTTQICLSLQCYFINDILNFDITANNNYYARPILDTNTFLAAQPSNWGNYMTLEQWKVYKSQDANSKKSPQTITSESDLQFEYNATSTPRTIVPNWASIDVTGRDYRAPFILQPYESLILIKDYTPSIYVPYGVNGKLWKF